MHYKTLCGKPYLSADDLTDGIDVPVIIANAYKEMAYNKKKRQDEEIGVVEFEGRTLKLILNLTNATTIAKAYGNDSSSWIGKPIILYKTKTRFGNENPDCIRIKI